MITEKDLREINGLYSRLLLLRTNMKRDNDYIVGILRVENLLRTFGMEPGKTEIPPVPPNNPISEAMKEAKAA